MKLLLDTNAFLWFIAADSSLSTPARTAIEDPTNEKFVSLASLWEIAIKVSLGKLALSDTFENLFPQQVLINGFELLEIKVEHTAEVTKLPFHHRDPFDRLLVSQANVEKLSIVSVDKIFDDYLLSRIW